MPVAHESGFVINLHVPANEDGVKKQIENLLLRKGPDQVAVYTVQRVGYNTHDNMVEYVIRCWKVTPNTKTTFLNRIQQYACTFVSLLLTLFVSEFEHYKVHERPFNDEEISAEPLLSAVGLIPTKQYAQSTSGGRMLLPIKVLSYPLGAN